MKTLFIFGTRPEAIKLAPVIKRFRSDKSLDVKVCVTAQHREMLDQVLSFFGIRIDFDLNLMRENQSLFEITSKGIKELDAVLEQEKPDMILVQGDTTTAFLGALSGFYKKIKVAHIEAGLRSHNKYSPFPEEINRIITSHIADYHFAPTWRAKQNLINEGIRNNIYVVGNTVVDALLLGLKIIEEMSEERFRMTFSFIDFSKRIIFVTGHRRESFGKPFEDICYALRNLSYSFDDIDIVYPVHLNPNVRSPVFSILNNHKNIHLIEPLNYPEFIWLLNKSYLVLTDSGGIQEEAPSLGKPVLVMRDVTERIEGIEAGTAKLVGTDRNRIVEETSKLLSCMDSYNRMSKAINPYGDGKASERILNIIMQVIKIS